LAVAVKAEELKVPNLERLVDTALERLKALSEALAPLLDVAEGISRKYEGYYFEVTWVKNPAGDRYYYAYLKSKTRTPRSIYLGKASKLTQGHFELRKLGSELRKAAKSLDNLHTLLSMLKDISSRAG